MSQLLSYSNVDDDALLYLPEKFDYQLCLGVIIFGFLISFIMIVVFSILELIHSNKKQTHRRELYFFKRLL